MRCLRDICDFSLEPFFGIPVLTLKEVAGDVISGQRAFGVEVVPLTKFGDPSSNRLATIQNAADGRTDRRTDGHARKKSPSYALHALHRWANYNASYESYDRNCNLYVKYS